VNSTTIYPLEPSGSQKKNEQKIEICRPALISLPLDVWAAKSCTIGSCEGTVTIQVIIDTTNLYSCVYITAHNINTVTKEREQKQTQAQQVVL